MVDVPAPGLAATTDPRDILFPEEHYILSQEFIIKDISIQPAASEFGSSRVHLGVKPGHYPAILRKMQQAGMIVFLEPNDAVLENAVFGVWKEIGQRQRLIWGGTRSNQFFRSEASRVELPTPDVLAALRLPEGQSLFLVSCDISQYYNRLKARTGRSNL